MFIRFSTWLLISSLSFYSFIVTGESIDELESELILNQSSIVEPVKTKPGTTKPIKTETIKAISVEIQPIDASIKKEVASVVSSGVPEGFDDLLAPQLALMDVYYNGQPIVSTIATYTQDWVQLEKPNDVLALLTDLKDPQAILSVLEKKMPTNSQQLCRYQIRQQCGFINPNVVGVIFDEATFRLDLFVNPILINPSLIKMDKYLPASTSGLSFVNSISLVASGGENIKDIHAIQLNSVLGFENYRLQMNVDNDSENQTRIDQISFVYDYRDIAYEIGSFKSFTQSNGFYTQRDFIGARIQTSLSSRTDLEQVTGSSLFVFLSERSRVDIFMDGQLIDSANYDPGNTQIDTRNFPNGAYDVELKITGISGRETTETHFYSKSLRLPPLDETLYFAEVGFPESNSNIEREHYQIPHSESHAVLRAGFVSRISEKLGLNSSIAVNSSDFSGELGSFVLLDQFSFQNNYILSKHDGIGSFYQIDYSLKNLVVSASYRKTVREAQIKYDLSYELLQNDSRQVLLNMAIPFESSALNFFARESEREGESASRIYGFNWRKNIYRGAGSLVDFSVDATRDDSETRVLFGFNLRFFSTHFDATLSARQNHRKLKSENIQLADSQLSNNFVDRNLRVSYRNQSESLGKMVNTFDANQEQLRRSIGLKSEISNEHGFGRVELQQVTNELGEDKTRQLAYSVTSRFNIVASEGKFSIGGDRRNTAGVMIDLESIGSESTDSDSLSFAVIINGVQRAKIDAGKSRFVALQPYETYQVVLSPRGETLVDFDNKPKVVTLYPGNIKNLAWDIKPVKVVIMQVLDFAEQPIANARLIEFKDYARTDDLGWIQLRLQQSGQLKFTDQNGNECLVDISEDELLETVNYLAEKRCQ